MTGNRAAIRLELPLPPSINACYRNVDKVGRVKTAALKNWLADAQGYYTLVKRQLSPVIGPYKFSMFVPQKMRGDIDNRLKAASDFFVSMQLTPDDRHCQEFRVVRSPEVREHFCVVEVEAA